MRTATGGAKSPVENYKNILGNIGSYRTSFVPEEVIMTLDSLNERRLKSQSTISNPH